MRVATSGATGGGGDEVGCTTRGESVGRRLEAAAGARAGAEAKRAAKRAVRARR